MPSSNRGMFGRGNGTVTVIEQPVMRSYLRKAKIVFYVILVITATLTATVAASKWQPLLALFAGLVLGTVIAAITAGIVAAWPVIRAIWWWTPETGIAGSLIFGWVELAEHTNLYWRLAAVFVIIGVPAAIKPVRDRINQAAWCLVTRHRIRTCFSEFIITNATGSLPLILWARPTPVGERVWIWLRPGLSLDDLQNRLDKIAVACWASTALAETASRSNAAFVRHGYQAPRHADRHHHLTPAGHDQVRRSRLRAGHHRDPGRAGPVPGSRQRGHHKPSGTAEAAGRSPVA